MDTLPNTYKWTRLISLEGIEPFLQAQDLDCLGIHFQGAGVYFGGDSTLLIIPEKGQWRIFCWNSKIEV